MRTFKHLSRMRERCLRDIARKHARDFSAAFFSADANKACFRDIAFAFLHDVMRICGDGDLRQMRNDDNLVRSRQVSENPRKRHGRRPADAGINLVEQQRIDCVFVA